MFIHEDHRRTLIECFTGDFKLVKALVAKTTSRVGDHHHRNRDESFFLLSGRASMVMIGDKTWTDVRQYAEFTVPRNTYHAFDLEEGSVLLEVSSTLYDPKDEIPGQPGQSMMLAK